MSSRNVLVIGGSKGIGLAVSKALLALGSTYTVTVVARSKPADLEGKATFVPADLSSIKACQDLVAVGLKGQKFDTVLACVGIISRAQLTLTPTDNIEEDFMVSYLSRFVILNELATRQMLTGRKRIYVWGYPGQKLEPINPTDWSFETNPEAYKQIGAHMNTVVCNEALVFELAERYPDLHVFGMNPGLIQTDIRDNFHGGAGSSWMGWVIESLIWLTNISVDKYAQQYAVPLIESPALDSQTAKMFSQKGKELASKGWVTDKANRIMIWQFCEDLVKRKTAA
jgi:NAD(P)-dependent dehydrogenase (short-subunit alcohol dehydrogenase family)